MTDPEGRTKRAQFCPWCGEDTGLLTNPMDKEPEPMPPCPRCGKPLVALAEYSVTEENGEEFWWELERGP
jgi:ribosomal protein S27AE